MGRFEGKAASTKQLNGTGITISMSAIDEWYAFILDAVACLLIASSPATPYFSPKNLPKRRNAKTNQPRGQAQCPSEQPALHHLDRRWFNAQPLTQSRRGAPPTQTQPSRQSRWRGEFFRGVHQRFRATNNRCKYGALGVWPQTRIRQIPHHCSA